MFSNGYAAPILAHLNNVNMSQVETKL